jgi:hypothetical protein
MVNDRGVATVFVTRDCSKHGAFERLSVTSLPSAL